MKLCYVRKATITQQAGLFAHLPPWRRGVMAPPPEPPGPGSRGPASAPPCSSSQDQHPPHVRWPLSMTTRHVYMLATWPLQAGKGRISKKCRKARAVTPALTNCWTLIPHKDHHHHPWTSPWLLPISGTKKARAEPDASITNIPSGIFSDSHLLTCLANILADNGQAAPVDEALLPVMQTGEKRAMHTAGLQSLHRGSSLERTSPCPPPTSTLLSDARWDGRPLQEHRHGRQSPVVTG